MQRVVAKKESDATQTRLASEHLRDIEGEFNRGDFSAPSHIYGAGMPGLAQLKTARLGDIAIRNAISKWSGC